MSSRAVNLWQLCLQQLSAATDAASPAAAQDAVDVVLEVLSELGDLNPLPSAICKRLVKDAKVVQLLCKAFNDAAIKDPLSPATAAASFSLWHMLVVVPVTGKAAAGNSPPGNAQPRGGRSSSSSRPLNSLAAEVHRQLQDSGLQQQLARTMEAVAQQLEAEAADPAALAAWWQSEDSVVLWTIDQADALLATLTQILFTAPDSTAFWLQSGAGAAVAHLSLSVLQHVSALMQQLAQPSGDQLTLQSGYTPDAAMVDELFGRVDNAWKACKRLQLEAARARAHANDQQHTSGILSSAHFFELNIACIAADALWLQHAGGESPETAGSSSGSGGDSSSRRMSSAASSQQPDTAHERGSAGDSTDSVVKDWSRAHQQAASLTPLQQQLCSQLRVDARVLLWCLQEDSAERCVGRGVVGQSVHDSALTFWSKTGRLYWHQQASGGLQQPEQLQPQQSQWSADTEQSQRALQLHLLLQCVTLPCCLAALHSSISSNSELSAIARSALGPAASYIKAAMRSLCTLPRDLASAVTAAGSQTFAMHAWLEDVLQSLLLLSAHLNGGQQGTQQQQQDSDSEGALSVAGTAAASHVLVGLLEVIKAVCASWRQAITPAVFPQWKGLAGSGAAADAACALQPAYAAPLQQHTTAILAQLDACVRASHWCAAAGADTASTSTQGPKTLSSQALGLCCELLCDDIRWGLRPLFALVMWAQQAGPGSKEQRQLYSLLASLLKLCGDSCVVRGDDAEQLDLSRRCRHGAAEAAGMLLLNDATGSSSSSSSSSAAAAAGAGAVHADQHAPRPALQLLPSLVVFGRVCLQWAQELQLQADTVMEQRSAPIKLDYFSALGICCVGPSTSTRHAVRSRLARSSTSTVGVITEHFHAWLSKQHITAQLAAAGYDPHGLLQELELLKQGAAKAAAGVAVATRRQHLIVARAVRPLVQQLLAVGAACGTLAVQAFCNNPSCNNISGTTEQQLVSGRSCVCAGCRTARFCSRACLKQHWKAHKPVCQALAEMQSQQAVGGN